MVQNYRRLGLTSRLNAPAGGTEKKIPSSTSSFSSSSHVISDSRGRDGRVGKDLVDGLAITSGGGAGNATTVLIPTEVRVERDPDTGRILRVIRSDRDPGSKNGVGGVVADGRWKGMRLDDPLNSDSNSDPDPDRRSRSPSENERDTASNSQLAPSMPPPPTGIVPALEAQAAEEAARLASKKRPRQQSRMEREWIAGLVQKYGDNVAAMARDKKLNPMQQTEADIARRVKRWTGSSGVAEAPTPNTSTLPGAKQPLVLAQIG